MDLRPIVLTLAAAFGVAALATPLVCRLASAVQAVDCPNSRKVNKRPGIPLLGGLAVAAGLAAGVGAAYWALSGALDFRGHIEGLFVGGALMLAVGAYDDRFGLTAVPKLAVQIAAAAVAVYYGFRLDYVTVPVTMETWWLEPWFACLVSVGWIVLITNSINLLDGLDGLASGISAIIAATLVGICVLIGQTAGIYLGAALVGGLLGFLIFNFPPARIFLGDAGSLFIGFTLSLLALEGYRQVAVLPFVVPVLAMMVPLADTSLSVVRRLRKRTNIFSADRAHMHHRLLSLFGSQRAAVLRMWGMTTVFCLIAIAITQLRGAWFAAYLVLVLVLTVNLLRNLGLFDLGDPIAAEVAAAAEPEAPGAAGPRKADATAVAAGEARRAAAEGNRL